MIPILGFVTGDGTYKALFLVHLMAVIAAFGPAFTYSLLGREAARRGGEAGAAVAAVSPLLNKRTSFPALIVATLAGIALVMKSDDIWRFDQAWVSAAFAIVLVLLLLSWFVLGPGLHRLQAAIAKGESGKEELRAAKAVTGMATGMFHLSLVVLIILMVWKPGYP